MKWRLQRTASCRAKWSRKDRTSSYLRGEESTASFGHAKRPLTILQSPQMSQWVGMQKQPTLCGQLRTLRACTAVMGPGMISTTAIRAQRRTRKSPHPLTQALTTGERDELLAAAVTLQVLRQLLILIRNVTRTHRNPKQPGCNPWLVEALRRSVLGCCSCWLCINLGLAFYQSSWATTRRSSMTERLFWLSTSQ